MIVDPYTDPQTGILRNKVGARTQEELDVREGDLLVPKALGLLAKPVKASNDLDELKAIHYRLFQDVYDWAGKIRTVDIRKNVEGSQFFLPVSMIERASIFVAKELREDNLLQGMSRDQFIDRLDLSRDGA